MLDDATVLVLGSLGILIALLLAVLAAVDAAAAHEKARALASESGKRRVNSTTPLSSRAIVEAMRGLPGKGRRG